MTHTILFVHSSDELYGSDIILKQIVENLDPTRYRPIVVIPNDISYEGLLTTALQAKGIRVVHLKTAVLRRMYFSPFGFFVYLSRLISSTLSLLRIINREKPVLIHTNTAVVFPGAFAAFLAGIPHIWHIHEIIREPRLLWRLTSWLIPRLSVEVIAVSQAVKDNLVSGDALNSKKCRVIYNGLDSRKFANISKMRNSVRDSWFIKTDTVLVGMIGRFSKIKGQADFIRAAALAVNKGHNLVFSLVGGALPGQEFLIDEIREFCREYEISDRMIISEFRRDIPAVLAAFDIFIMPSIIPEALGMVVLEAMAAAKPVISYAHGGPLEIIVNNKTGLLVPPCHPEYLAEAILSLADDPKKCFEMGIAGQQRVDELFTMDKFIYNWSLCYERVITPINDDMVVIEKS